MGTYETMKACLTRSQALAPGSWALENLAAVAAELDRLEQMGIEDMPNRFFPLLATGEDLTRAAANFGVTRKEAAAAGGEVTFSGDAGAAVTTDTRIAAGDLLFAPLQGGTLDGEGALTLPVVCLTPGAAGNLPAGSLCRTVTEYPGITAVTNAAATTGGRDAEADTALRQRVQDRWEYPSAGGSLGDYRRWALEVPGTARVKALNPAAGQVRLVLVAEGNTTPNAALLAAVSSAIEEVRPVGAAVTVTAATPITVHVAATVTPEAGFTLQQVTDSAREALEARLAEWAFTRSQISYLALAEALFVPGAADVSGVTVNSGTASISLGTEEFGVLGSVQLVAAE